MKTIKLPGSKSIVNRDLILAALVDQKSYLRGMVFCDDTRFMINALQKLGIKVRIDGDVVSIYGGRSNIYGDGAQLYMGNAGTAMRFITGFVALNKEGKIEITGSKRMQERPIGYLVDSLKQLGVNIVSNDGCPPLEIYGIGDINKSKVYMKGDVSSQFFSSLMLIAPALNNGLEIEVMGDLVSKPYIDITINELSKFGIEVDNEDYKKFIIRKQKILPVDILIEGDASAMSYICQYMILHGGEITIQNLGKDTKQGDYKLLEILEIFGLEHSSDGETTNLKVSGLSDIDVSKYKDFEIDFEDMPDVSMTFMVLSIFLPGVTKITGLSNLNIKECKRIDAMRDEMRKLGVEVNSDDSSIEIGEFKDFPLEEIEIETYDDHRIAMCFGVLNTYIGNLYVRNSKCVSKSYPGFWKDLEDLEAGKSQG